MINITGLAIGLASLLLIVLFIHDEFSFDQYHEKSDRIYRITLDFTSEGNTISWARTSAPIGHYLPGVYPEIEEVVRIRKIRELIYLHIMNSNSMRNAFSLQTALCSRFLIFR